MNNYKCDEDKLQEFLSEKCYNIEDNGVDKYNISNRLLYNKDKIIESFISYYTCLNKINNNKKNKILTHIYELLPNSNVEKKIMEKILKKLILYNNRLIKKENDSPYDNFP